MTTNRTPEYSNTKGRTEAETKLRPLAAKVAELSRHLAELQKRAAGEVANLGTAEETLAQLKSAAGAYLTDSPGAFDRFKTNLKRTTARVETLRESIGIFTTELVPGKERELEAARATLERAYRAFYKSQLPACESRMADLLAQVVVEHDAFLSAFAELREDFRTISIDGEPPRACHGRLSGIDRYGLGGLPWVTFTPPPPATMPAAVVCDMPKAAESTRTGEVGESATGDAPCPCRARVLLRTPGDAGEVPPTPLEPPQEAPADLDPPDTLPLDAAEAEAEAPPVDGEKENPGIAAEIETHPHGVAPV
ncbi:MAG: hypothetical protein NTY65_01850 [Planctomycetota bacterium]|nr:hypothetical protein [Planctomycetota bacterium]